MKAIAVLVLATTLLASRPTAGMGQAVGRATTPVAAQSRADSVLEAQTTVLASELRCPVCQGNSIQDSPSELALQMRDVIRDQLRAGKTPDEVRAYFVAKYGEWILLTPKAEGLNLVVYLVPLAAIVIGGLVVWRTVRRWTSVPPIAPRDDTSGS